MGWKHESTWGTAHVKLPASSRCKLDRPRFGRVQKGAAQSNGCQGKAKWEAGDRVHGTRYLFDGAKPNPAPLCRLELCRYFNMSRLTTAHSLSQGPQSSRLS